LRNTFFPVLADRVVANGCDVRAMKKITRPTQLSPILDSELLRKVIGGITAAAPSAEQNADKSLSEDQKLNRPRL
jgi:hypothetical protein